MAKNVQFHPIKPKIEKKGGLLSPTFDIIVTVTEISARNPKNAPSCPKMHILNLGQTYLDSKFKNICFFPQILT